MRISPVDPSAIRLQPLAMAALAAGLFLLLLRLPAMAVSTPSFVEQLHSYGLGGLPGEKYPALADIDADGDLDAFVGEFNGSMLFFENIGSATTPDFADPVVNPFGLADPRTFGPPSFVDIDADGDLDAFVESGFTPPFFFENLGTASAPAFGPPVDAPFGLPVMAAFADIDADGDFDAFVPNGFFENVGTASAPAFAQATNLLAVPFFPGGVMALPAIYDLDGDGDLDALVGQGGGFGGGPFSVVFLENTGTASSPVFAAPVLDPFGLPGLFVGRGLSLEDIDADGDADLFVDHFGGALLFENTGTASAPVFSNPSLLPFGLANFDVRNAPALGDIDGDGDLDAFVGEGDGDTIFYENIGTATSPLFSTRSINPFGLSGGDYRLVLVDIDGDGDRDGFSGTVDGNTVFFESTGTAAAPAFAPPVNDPFGLADLGIGLAEPTFGDIDADGDIDALIEDGQGNLEFFENTGTATAPAFTSPVTNPFGLVATNTRVPTLVDIDADGDLDLFTTRLFFENTGSPAAPAFAAPVNNTFGFTPPDHYDLGDIDGDGDLDLFLQFDSGVEFLENTGTAFAPVFEFPTIDDPFGLLRSTVFGLPSLGDIDGDGDLDVFLWQANQWFFFENVGTPSAPVFDGRSRNPFGLANVGLDSAPELGDIDADGDLDVFIGESGGNTLFFENIGGTYTPRFAAPVTNPFGLADVGSASTPELVDIDADGDLDAFIGESGGNTLFFRNVGTPSAPAFAAPATNPFGLADVGSYSVPAFADLDSDGDLDAVIGESDGNTVVFLNTGTVASPAFSAPMTNPFGFADVGVRSAPELADIDGDGDPDAFIGLFGAGVGFFENLSLGCPAAPAPSCLGSAPKGSLVVNEKNPGREKLIAKFSQGTIAGDLLTSAADAPAGDRFGDPTVPDGTFYDLCVYDDQGALAGQLDVDRAGDSCAGEACWELTAVSLPTIYRRIYVYKDPEASADGVKSLKLRDGIPEKVEVQLKAQNRASAGQTSLPPGITSALATTTGVTMQLRSGGNGCLTTTLGNVVKQNSQFLRVK